MYRQSRMRLFFLLLAISLLSPWTADVYDKNTAPQETGHTDVAGSAVPALSIYATYGDSAVPSEGEGSSSQATELKNPTFQELKDFILRDPISRNKFVLNEYECRHFATEVNNNAEVEGLRCAFVLLCFDRGQHAVIAFDTIDRGLVYIEPQTDAVIHPEVGGSYQEKEITEILIAW